MRTCFSVFGLIQARLLLDLQASLACYWRLWRVKDEHEVAVPFYLRCRYLQNTVRPWEAPAVLYQHLHFILKAGAFLFVKGLDKMLKPTTIGGLPMAIRSAHKLSTTFLVGLAGCRIGELVLRCIQ